MNIALFLLLSVHLHQTLSNNFNVELENGKHVVVSQAGIASNQQCRKCKTMKCVKQKCENPLRAVDQGCIICKNNKACQKKRCPNVDPGAQIVIALSAGLRLQAGRKRLKRCAPGVARTVTSGSVNASRVQTRNGIAPISAATGTTNSCSLVKIRRDQTTEEATMENQDLDLIGLDYRKTLLKAQRTRGLSSVFQSNLFRSYHTNLDQIYLQNLDQAPT